MSNAWAIVAAGGSGTRFSTTTDKLLATLGDRPVFIHTLEAILATPSVEGIVFVVPAAKQTVYPEVVQQWIETNKPIRWAVGGETRRDSVCHGLAALPELAEIVAIHDAARPLIKPVWVEEAITHVRGTGEAAVLGIPVTDTVKRVSKESHRVVETIDRSTLWRVQTPQVFPTSLLRAAHQQVSQEIPVTDDAQLLELSGLGTIQLIEADESNLKITTPADLALATFWLQQSH